MPARIINGKAIANEIKQSIASTITERKANGRRAPGLAVILVGDDPASTIYVKNKRAACAEVGIESTHYPLPNTVTEETLITLIESINADPTVDGLLLQLPLPPHINTERVIESIHPTKDVDGFHPYNLGRLVRKAPLLRPCTPKGIITLLNHLNLPTIGQHAVVIGASNIVGRPMALELLMAGSTVTTCHRATRDLKSHTLAADILISATGNPHFITADMIKPDAVVIDVGITRLPSGHLAGDIDYDAVKSIASWITPVPGGVGPMTVAMLLENTLLASEFSRSTA